jgi:hypothetical protein
MRILLAAMLALAAAPALGQDNVVPNVPRGVQVDGLGVTLIHTADRDAFMRNWNAGIRTLPVTDRAVRGRPLASIVLFKGCRAAADGKCNLTGHFTYLRPDGSVAGEIDGGLWREAPAPDDFVIASSGGPELVIETRDPMGTWTVRMRVTDNVRGVSVETEARIVVDTPPMAAAPLPS